LYFFTVDNEYYAVYNDDIKHATRRDLKGEMKNEKGIIHRSGNYYDAESADRLCHQRR
jgi:hypothetical protein